MSLTAGIVGLPNVGKSTLFNAITKKNILAANYPFATIDPNVGVVVVPDERLDFLSELYKPKSLVPTTFEFTDIAGLVKGASTGEGLGNKFLSHIREVDAIVEVVRCFEDNNIIHVENTVDPIRDIEIIDIELMLSDLEMIVTRLGKIEKKAISTKDKELLKEVELLNKLKNSLEENIPVRRIDLSEDEQKLISSFRLITAKPIIYMANISEEDLLNDGNEHVEKIREYAKKDWAMQLHYGVQRDLNKKVFRALGADAGIDAINNYTSAIEMGQYLNALAETDELPKTILYSLNPVDDATIGTIIGCFQDSSAVGKIQQGSAWWFNDNKQGMINQMVSLANLGLLGNFIGMLTDSRSFLSYTRHEYFRRIMCELIGGWVENGEYPNDEKALEKIVKGISYNNTVRYFGFDIK